MCVIWKPHERVVRAGQGEPPRKIALTLVGFLTQTVFLTHQTVTKCSEARTSAKPSNGSILDFIYPAIAAASPRRRET